MFLDTMFETRKKCLGMGQKVDALQPISWLRWASEKSIQSIGFVEQNQGGKWSLRVTRPWEVSCFLCLPALICYLFCFFLFSVWFFVRSRFDFDFSTHSIFDVFFSLVTDSIWVVVCCFALGIPRNDFKTWAGQTAAFYRDNLTLLSCVHLDFTISGSQYVNYQQNFKASNFSVPNCKFLGKKVVLFSWLHNSKSCYSYASRLANPKSGLNGTNALTACRLSTASIIQLWTHQHFTVIATDKIIY